MDEIVIIQNKDNKKYNESPDIIDLSIDNYNEEIIDKLKLIENKLEKMHIEKIEKVDKNNIVIDSNEIGKLKTE
eukprot:CAMPEP_0116992592 /NCGR_PEP_ID=MMETSP0467-20121206/66897_1 /TAXON_ID=283647 /ORGANISM="Mesodinium pulex, Strain SPMC105" /LENGTH=73 /DNA_ID=CAMNT_0004690039 /DNA_START=620 /DNA_END=838 /DNA_ORIENTATION=+